MNYVKALLVGSFCMGALAAPVLAQRPSRVLVGGRRVEVVRVGKGTPALVMESGLGAGAEAWQKVLPELARHARVIAYSRAGTGGSESRPERRSPQVIVRELHQLLRTLGERGPIVLVGHSLGGLFARLYVSTFPNDVAGLILVDGTHEAQFALWDTLHPGTKLATTVRTRLPTLTPAARSDYELLLEVEEQGRVNGLEPLPDLPLAVITALKPCRAARDWTCREPRALAVWRQLHDEWFARSSNALRLVSTRSGQDVMADQPDLVIEAVRFVLAQVRARNRS